jgi:hypothetical protein
MKEHPTYKGILVSETGEVFSCKVPGMNQHRTLYDYENPKKLSLFKNKRGYLTVTVGINNTRYVHRLVAETYIPNPDNLPQVNHKDENKSNNEVDNLEWITNTDNARHSFCKYEWLIENIITGHIIRTNNLNQFSEKNNLNSGSLYATLTGKQRQHRNFRIISKTKFK